MPKVASALQLHYLALEGGGGKGVAFLGAIRALEKLGVLPIKPKDKGGNQIRGISGASAGAITALMLAMGVNSEQLQRMLSRPQDFNKFFDKPQPGFYRSVNEKNLPDTKSDADLENHRASFEESIKLIKQRKSEVDIVAGPVALAQLTALAFMGLVSLFGDIKQKKSLEDLKGDPILNSLRLEPETYVYNLIYDRGLFPGFAVRAFFAGAIEAFLGQRLQEKGLFGKSVNFEQFYDLTGVDLVITGANVTQKCPLNFSYRLTPKFPVAEAVGISMNLPFLFKPVWVDAQVPTNRKNPNPKSYQGFWVDGGLLNNLPIHAFNDVGATTPSKNDPDIYPLNPNTLGIRLTDGFKDRAKNVAAEEKSGKPSVFDNLSKHLAAIVNTVLYPSEQGQIRTPSELEQTIDLYTDELQTTEFAPPESRRAGPIKHAEEDVLAYFQI